MSTQDTSSFFTTHQTRDVPRDRYGRYMLPGPDGQEKSWTRATTFAATLAEQYGLRIWKERQVVWGLSRRPDLLTMATTIAGPEDKKALGAIVDDAHVAAGTDAKANRGTAIHLACAAAERGAYGQVPAEFQKHVSRYLEAVRGAGLTIVPDWVERTVIVPQYEVAGTADNFVRCPDGRVRVLDKKTGRLDYSDTEFAVQMALYANAKAMRNFDTNTYEPMPENLATDYAILANIDPESGHCELQRVNIAWGWTWARTCAEVRDIRQTKHVITPHITDGMDSHAMTPAQESRQPIMLTTSYNQQAANDADTVNRMQAFGATESEVDQHLTNNGAGPDGFTEEQRYHAFWSDDRHDFPNELTDDETCGCGGIDPDGHVDGCPNDVGVTVNEHPIETPQPVPPSPTETAAVASEGASQTDNVDAIATALNKLSKAHSQAVARNLMAQLGIKEGDPGSIKLNQYKSKVCAEIITLAHKHGVAIPGVKPEDPGFGMPTGPAPTSPAAPTGAQKASGERDTAEVDPGREAMVRSAVGMIQSASSIENLQRLHAEYSKTPLGWTEEMQNAARVQAAQIEAAAGESPLTPLEMIQGATSQETLAKAWQKATNGGTELSGWTEEMNGAAIAKQTELASLAPSGNE